MKRLILEGEGERQRRLNVPVARLPVQKDVLAMSLVFLQVQVPDVPVILDQNLGGRITGGAGCEGEEVPHLAGFLSSARVCQLKFEKKMVTLRGRAVLKGKPETEKQILRIRPDTADELQRINRKLLVGLRLRRMLISEGIEAVIGAHKEILPADMRSAVKWRFMAQCALAVLMPNNLLLLRNHPPGGERPPVNLQGSPLCLRPFERTLRFLLVIALAVQMIEGQVSNGAPTIGNEYGWLEARHNLSL